MKIIDLDTVDSRTVRAPVERVVIEVAEGVAPVARQTAVGMLEVISR